MRGWAETHRYRIYMDADFSGHLAEDKEALRGALI
jgi:hypothetical protein